jgi:D-psicose/D-tagatose/L-ribulose 3-epimerase
VIVAAPNCPGLRTMLDCCSGSISESMPLDSVLDQWQPGGMNAHRHASDRNLRGPGGGSIRFAAIIAALKRHGYNGTIGVEPFIFEPSAKPAPPAPPAICVG